MTDIAPRSYPRPPCTLFTEPMTDFPAGPADHRSNDDGRLQSQWTELNGGRIHALAAADAAPAGRVAVVLVHGQGMSSHYMKPLMRRLAPDFPVYAPDQPGFGSSHKPSHALDIAELADFLAEWMDAVGLRRAALFGNSFGCQVCVEFALRHPGRLDRMVLQGPTADPRARRAAPERAVAGERAPRGGQPSDRAPRVLARRPRPGG